LHGILPQYFDIPEGSACSDTKSSCPDMKNSNKPELEISTDGQFCFISGPYHCWHFLAGGLFQEVYDYNPKYHFENDVVGPAKDPIPSYARQELQQVKDQCNNRINPDIKAEFQDGNICVQQGVPFSILWDSTSSSYCTVSSTNWIDRSGFRKTSINNDTTFTLTCIGEGPPKSDQVTVNICSIPTCGDGNCDPGENCINCLSDCGAPECPPTAEFKVIKGMVSIPQCLNNGSNYLKIPIGEEYTLCWQCDNSTTCDISGDSINCTIPQGASIEVTGSQIPITYELTCWQYDRQATASVQVEGTCPLCEPCLPCQTCVCGKCRGTPCE